MQDRLNNRHYNTSYNKRKYNPQITLGITTTQYETIFLANQAEQEHQFK